MSCIVVTGGPGAGKTTLLAELAKWGHAIVPESARAIIAERLARGESPRPGPLAFAQEILRRDIERSSRQAQSTQLVFFDRCVIEAAGMLQAAGGLTSAELQRLLATYHFHRQVFMLPPWEAIYACDAERDHTFAHSVRVHTDLVAWYGACGYRLVEVPCLAVAERARFVMGALSGHGA